MKPTQPHGAVESRVWYAHNLVVSEQHEAKGGESAVAAAARLALESTKSLPRAKVRSRNRTGWFVGVSLAGAAIAAVSLPWQEAAGPDPAITRAPQASPVETAQKVVPAAGGAAVEKVAAANADQAGDSASEAAVPAPVKKLAVTEPGMAEFSATETASITTGTAIPGGSATESGSVPASPFAASPASPGAGAGEIVPSSSAPEIETVEFDEGEPPSADDDDRDETADTSEASNTAAAKVPRVKKRPASSKQSAEYYQTGDCAMPPWAWRVFGFQEPVKRKRGCGG